jgi:hypothetical protein
LPHDELLGKGMDLKIGLKFVPHRIAEPVIIDSRLGKYFCDPVPISCGLLSAARDRKLEGARSGKLDVRAEIFDKGAL